MLLSSESSDDAIETPLLSQHNPTKRTKKRKKQSDPTEPKPKLKRKAKAKKQTHIPTESHPNTPSKGRTHTLSIALPGSIIDNAQSKELKTYLAGQIARAAVIFQVDEIVIYDDQHSSKSNANAQDKKSGNDCHTFLIRVLKYLETPQYLRKALFPMHPDLQYAGLLNPLDCAHHMRTTESYAYREGVITDRQLKESKGSFVYVGLAKEIAIDKRIHPGIRVTVKLEDPLAKKRTLVSPNEPREKEGIYWGYTCRFAPSLRHALNDSPFEKGYDLKIGTSERGHPFIDDQNFTFPQCKHVLVVFGGISGIEQCIHSDESIPMNEDEAHRLFDYWVNTCPNQGSRTIRTEEAILVSLAALRPHWKFDKG